MYRRESVDTLPAHLERVLGIVVTKLTQLDVGVFRVDRRAKESPLVARLFPGARSFKAAEGDLAVLRYLARVDFPAERPFGDEPLSAHDGQAVLVSEFVRQAPKTKRPAFPILSLGALIGRLHGLPLPPDVDRPAGALHHFAEGTMEDELRAAAGWLDAIEAGAPSRAGTGLDALRNAIASADGGDGLPEGFVHPDPVPKNVIFTASGPVLIDWTAAGRGPRLASLTLVLRSGWAAAPFLRGYSREVSLTEDELDRLAGLLLSRALIDVAFRACLDPENVPSAASKLRWLKRESESKARGLIDGVLTSEPGRPARNEHV